jgi:putative effector of murein hydrolase LrgA (UPF0299 family)
MDFFLLVQKTDRSLQRLNCVSFYPVEESKLLGKRYILLLFYPATVSIVRNFDLVMEEMARQ